MNDQAGIRLGTRGSALALWQAETVRDLLSREAPMRDVEIVIVKTLGDQVQDRDIASIGRTAVFTAELDRALVDGVIDIGVHSLKDVETTTPEGVELAAVLPRGPVEDVVVGVRTLKELPAGSRVGTGSVRRAAQLQAAFPLLAATPIRGNVPTRIEKLDQGDFDALIMARAGLVRLGLAHRIVEVLDPAVFLPAVGQGAVAVTCRPDDVAMRRILADVNHGPTWRIVMTERDLLKRLGGGCNVPLGVFGELTDPGARFRAVVYASDGSRQVSVDERFPAELEPQQMGRVLADRLASLGARELI